MEIIPVMDILGGKVVQAIRGEREKYKLVKSSLINSVEPLKVAKAFKEKLGLEKLYIADLDAIEGRGNNFDVIKEIKSKVGSKIMLDFGIRDCKDLDKDVIEIVDSIILGTETLQSLETVKEAFAIKEKNNLVISIDMKNGKVITKIKKFKYKSPEFVIRQFSSLGISNFILLDISKVGTMEGVSKRFKKLIQDLDNTGLHLIVGGGINSFKGVEELGRLHIAGILIATALHNQEIGIKDIYKILRL